MYNAFKTQLSDLLGISKDALHIHLGLAIYLIVVVVFRRPLASWVPWLALLGFEIVNEFMPGSSTASDMAEMNGHSSLQIDEPTPWPKCPRPYWSYPASHIVVAVA